MLSTTDDEGIVRIYKRTFSRFRLESTAIKKTLTPDSYVRKKLESPGIIGGGRTALGRRLEWALKVFFRKESYILCLICIANSH